MNPTLGDLMSGMRIGEESCCGTCTHLYACTHYVESPTLPPQYCRQCGALWITPTITWSPVLLPRACPWKLRWSQVCVTCSDCGVWITGVDHNGYPTSGFTYVYETGHHLRVYDMHEGYTPDPPSPQLEFVFKNDVHLG